MLLLKRRPILVTGSHRSGTTWVGRMLAAARGVAYVHEPFHIGRRPPIADLWFTYVCGENAHRFRASLSEVLLSAERSSGDSPRSGRARPLLKDPLALFAAEWMAAEFDTLNVVMIRHPAAFAGSLKARNWTHPFSHFLQQPLLLRDHLAGFASDIELFARTEQDVVEQAGLLWNIIHAVILEYRDAHPDWIYLRHEDLSRHPLHGFRALFERLDLDFSEEVEKTIVSHSTALEGAEPRSGEIRRDSLANLATWKTRLTAEEVERLKARAAPWSRHFYSEDEW